jgi:universal stress protein A
MNANVVEELSGATNFERTSGHSPQLKNILVPTDLSEDSAKAVKYAAALAQEFDSVVWLLNVSEIMPAFTGVEGVAIAMDPREELGRAEERMAEFAAKHVPAGVSVTSLVRQGRFVDEVSALAKDRSIDLVVISTHARTGWSRTIYGSLAERVLHHAPCPVLIVREDERDFFEEEIGVDGPARLRLRKIVAPLDLTACSKKTLRYAEAFAMTFGAELFCVHVIEPEKPKIVIETEALEKKHELAAGREFSARLQQLNSSVRMQSEIRHGLPHCEIVSAADERGADLIIMGEHCRSAARRFLVGSTADRVLESAHCPILVVREVEHEFVQ